MSEIKTRGSNGVSYGVTYTVQAQDVTDGSIVFNFQATRVPLVASITVLDASDVVVSTVGAIITYPEKGQVKIEEGGAFTLVDGQKVNLIAQFTRELPEA